MSEENCNAGPGRCAHGVLEDREYTACEAWKRGHDDGVILCIAVLLGAPLDNMEEMFHDRWRAACARYVTTGGVPIATKRAAIEGIVHDWIGDAVDTSPMVDSLLEVATAPTRERDIRLDERRGFLAMIVAGGALDQEERRSKMLTAVRRLIADLEPASNEDVRDSRIANDKALIDEKESDS